MSLITDFERLMRPAEEATPASDPAPGTARCAGFTAMEHREQELAVASLLRTAHAALVNELIARIHAQTPEFFEELVIDVLVKMGYGNSRRETAQRLGRTGDGGIDGVVAADELGLDLIYVQAKRLKPGSPVPVTDVRDFAGSLDARHAVKGVFFATNHFSASAVDFCAHLSRRVVLVDGERLAELMILHNIGVRVQESIQIKRIDRDYFVPASAGRIRDTIPASIQPRR